MKQKPKRVVEMKTVKYFTIIVNHVKN